MPENVNITLTQINAEIELLAVKERSGRVEVIAKVVDTGTIGNIEALAGDAIATVYRRNYNLPDERKISANRHTILPSIEDPKILIAYIVLDIR